MSLKTLAINGFGRIGRLVLRAALKKNHFQVVAINDLIEPEHLAYLFKYDSVHGTYPEPVEWKGDRLCIGSHTIRIYREKDPSQLPWKALGVDYVVESTGRFTQKQEAEKHLHAGAKRVILSAPGKDPMPTYVFGVNHQQFDPKVDYVVSNASCTTNCLAPLCSVLLRHYGIEEALMTTVHAMTSSQSTVDIACAKDWRRGRAASVNIVPASTGAAKAVTLCLPELKGKITGMAFRVPTLNVSAVDLTVRVQKKTSYEEICASMRQAAQGDLQGVLDVTTEPLVSSDFVGNPHSCIFDQGAGIGLGSYFYKIIAWYDNEMGYSSRIVDLMEYMASKE